MAARKRMRTRNTTQTQGFEAYFCPPPAHPKKRRETTEFVEAKTVLDPAVLPFMTRFQPQTDADLLDPGLKRVLKTFISGFSSRINGHASDSDVESPQALLITGASGTGKTASLRLLAKTMNLTLLEVSTKDVRSGQNLYKIVGEATQTHNVLKTAIILFDDIDVVFEQEKGFYRMVFDLLACSKAPIIMTAGKVPEEFLGKEFIIYYRLKPVSETDACGKMLEISEKTSLGVRENALLSLYRTNPGNMSGLLNTLQIQDLSLMFGFRSQVMTVESPDIGKINVSSPGRNWVSWNSDTEYSPWLSFLSGNVDKIDIDNIDKFSALEDLVSFYDGLDPGNEKEEGDGFSGTGKKSDVTEVQRRCGLHRFISILEKTVFKDMDTGLLSLSAKEPESRYQARAEYKEFPELLRAEQSSPYHTRSRKKLHHGLEIDSCLD